MTICIFIKKLNILSILMYILYIFSYCIRIQLEMPSGLGNIGLQI